MNLNKEVTFDPEVLTTHVPDSCQHHRNKQVQIKFWELMARIIKSIPLPHGFFLLSFVLFYLTFPKQLGMEGKVEGLCTGVSG